jgi:ATP-dependent protease ClpP protease subunit
MPNKISITILGDFGAWWGTNRRSIYNAISDNSVEEIDVFMSSYGGEAAEAFVIYDMLRSHKAKVNIFLSGVVASAATIVACAGDTVTASPTNIYMIHSASIFAYGNAAELRQTSKVLDVFDEQLLNIYLKRNEASGKRKIDRDAMAKMISDATWMTSDTALQIGFVDAVQDFSFDFEGQEIAYGLFASDPKEITTVQDYDTNIKVIQAHFQSNSHQLNFNNMKILNSISQSVVSALVQVGIIAAADSEKAINAISDSDFDNDAVSALVQAETKPILANVQTHAEQVSALQTRLETAEKALADITNQLASAQFQGINNQGGGSNGDATHKPNADNPKEINPVALNFYNQALGSGKITNEEYKRATGMDPA